MNPLALRPMTEAEFAAYAEASCADYARNSPHYRDRPLDETLPKVRAEFARRLPEGRATKGFLLLSVTLVEGGSERAVGSCEIGESPAGSRTVYIWNFVLDASVRGRGHGKRAFALVLERLRALGYAKVGLNVFADNAVARKIYEEAGFTVTQMNMERRLG